MPSAWLITSLSARLRHRRPTWRRFRFECKPAARETGRAIVENDKFHDPGLPTSFLSMYIGRDNVGSWAHRSTFLVWYALSNHRFSFVTYISKNRTRYAVENSLTAENPTRCGYVKIIAVGTVRIVSNLKMRITRRVLLSIDATTATVAAVKWHNCNNVTIQRW